MSLTNASVFSAFRWQKLDRCYPLQACLYLSAFLKLSLLYHLFREHDFPGLISAARLCCEFLAAHVEGRNELRTSSAAKNGPGIPFERES